eukprot:605383-Hanusia_phi.AAC.5
MDYRRVGRAEDHPITWIGTKNKSGKKVSDAPLAPVADGGEDSVDAPKVEMTFLKQLTDLNKKVHSMEAEVLTYKQDMKKMRGELTSLMDGKNKFWGKLDDPGNHKQAESALIFIQNVYKSLGEQSQTILDEYKQILLEIKSGSVAADSASPAAGATGGFDAGELRVEIQGVKSALETELNAAKADLATKIDDTGALVKSLETSISSAKTDLEAKMAADIEAAVKPKADATLLDSKVSELQKEIKDASTKLNKDIVDAFSAVSSGSASSSGAASADSVAFFNKEVNKCSEKFSALDARFSAELPPLQSTVTGLQADMLTYAKSTEVDTKIADFVSKTALATALADYEKTADVTAKVASLVEKTALTTTLADYVKTEFLEANYDNKAEVTTMVAKNVTDFLAMFFEHKNQVKEELNGITTLSARIATLETNVAHLEAALASASPAVAAASRADLLHIRDSLRVINGVFGGYIAGEYQQPIAEL